MANYKPHILTESILDDEELQDSYNDVNVDHLVKEVSDVDPSDCEFYVNIKYKYEKLYRETYWWQNWFTAHINVLDIYRDIQQIAQLSGLFKSFTIDKQIKMFGYENYQLSYINKTWEYPNLPEDFDVKAWYEEIENTYSQKVLLNRDKVATFYVRIYFNFDKNMSHKQFLKHLWKFLPGMNILRRTSKDYAGAIFFRNDENPDDRLELALVRDISHTSEPEQFSANYMFTPEQFDALYTALTGRDDYQEDSGRTHNYVQEKIINSTNFEKLMNYAAEQAKEKYGIILTPGNYQYPDKFSVYQRNLSDTSSWCAFTVENADSTKKEIDTYELEECIADCLLYRMSIHYFSICQFAVILRVIPKLVNRKAEEIRQEYVKKNTSPYGRVSNMSQEDKKFSHFENTIRPITSNDVRMNNNQWNSRVRRVTIDGEDVILIIGDKNGMVNKNKLRMDWPASSHNYIIDLMADNKLIWSENKEYTVQQLTESVLDNFTSDDIPSATDALLKKACREMEDDILDYEYYIYLKVNYIRPPYGAPTTVNIAGLYNELIDAVELSWLIPNKYYITYPHMGDELGRFDDVDYHFTSPLPEAFDLKNFYKEDYFNAAPYIDVMIYFNKLRHCTYPRFVKEMNLMLGYFHQAIKMTIPLSDGVMQIYFTKPENHDRRQIVHMHGVYTKRCYQNGVQYQAIYKEMFPGEATNQLEDLDADAAVQNLRKLDLKRLSANIERHAHEYNLDVTVKHSYRGIITDETPVPMSWIALDMKTLTCESKLDIREAEELLIDTVFCHLTSHMVTNTKLFIFVRADFDIYNREFEEKRAENPRLKKHSYQADKYVYPSHKLNSQTLTYISDTKSRPSIIDPRVREVKRERGNEVLGYILFFNKKGQMGRKPFSERGYIFGYDACLFIEDIVQTGLVWRPDFKPETIPDFI